MRDLKPDGRGSDKDVQGSDRIAWIDWARALGALGVVVLHVLTSTFLLIMDNISVVRFGAYTAVSIVLGRWAVPAFFMITGFLLLDPSRELGWRRALKYALRMLGVLATFGVVFSLMEEAAACLHAGTPIGPRIVPAAILDTLTCSSWGHLWYVYALVFVYLLAPIVRALAARLGTRGFALLTALLFCAALVLPTMVRLVAAFTTGATYEEQQGLASLVPNVACGLTCFCVGGCVRNCVVPWRMAVAAGAVSLLVMLGISLYGVVFFDNDLGFIFLQGSCFSCLYAVGVLELLRHADATSTLRSESLVDKLARDSFGIYLLHPVTIHAVLMVADPQAFAAGLFESVLYVLAVVSSAVLTRLVRRIPLVGRLV